MADLSGKKISWADKGDVNDYIDRCMFFPLSKRDRNARPQGKYNCACSCSYRFVVLHCRPNQELCEFFSQYIGLIFKATAKWSETGQG